MDRDLGPDPFNGKDSRHSDPEESSSHVRRRAETAPDRNAERLNRLEERTGSFADASRVVDLQAEVSALKTKIQALVRDSTQRLMPCCQSSSMNP